MNTPPSLPPAAAPASPPALPGTAPIPHDELMALLRRSCPGTPGEYALDLGDLDPSEIDTDLAEQFRNQAHACGLLPGQVQQLSRWYATALRERARKLEAATAEEEEAGTRTLEERFGNRLETELARASRALRVLGGPELTAELARYGLIGPSGTIRAPRLVEFLARIGGQLSEDSLVQGPGAGGMASPEAARAEITAKRSDPAFAAAYNDAAHPRHASAIAEMSRLYRMATS